MNNEEANNVYSAIGIIENTNGIENVNENDNTIVNRINPINNTNNNIYIKKQTIKKYPQNEKRKNVPLYIGDNRPYDKLMKVMKNNKFLSQNDTVRYLLDVEEKFRDQIKIKDKLECKRCGGKIDIPNNENFKTNFNLIQHKCNDGDCGKFIETSEIEKNDDGEECPHCHKHKLKFNKDSIQCTDCNKKFKLFEINDHIPNDNHTTNDDNKSVKEGFNIFQ